MEKQGTYDTILLLFKTLSEQQQVDLMVELYFSMYDLRKDQFLELTYNA